MSMIIQGAGVIQPPVCVRPTGTGVTDIHTPTDSMDTVAGILLANEDTVSRNALVYWYNGTTNFLILAKVLAANESFQFDMPIKLLSTHKIRAAVSAANVVTVSVIVAKAQRNVQTNNPMPQR